MRVMVVKQFLAQLNNDALVEETTGAGRVTVRHWRLGRRFPDRKYWPALIELSEGKLTLAVLDPDLANAVERQAAE
jgi:hypothetical protein